MSEDALGNEAVQPEISPEKLFTQSEVNEVAGRIRAETARKTRSQIESELRSKASESNSYAPSQPAVREEFPDLDERIRREVSKSLDSIVSEMTAAESQRSAEEMVHSFLEKLGNEPFSADVSDILSDGYNFGDLGQVIPVIKDVDNPREVFEHLMTHPGQLAALRSCVKNQSVKAARLEVSRLSKGLKENSKKHENVARDPIPKVESYNGSGGAKTTEAMSVSEMRKYFAKRM